MKLFSKKSRVRWATGLVATAISVFMAAPPARADINSCPDGWFCLWSQEDGWGTRWTFNNARIGDGIGSLTPGDLPSGFNNNTESMYNRAHSTTYVMFDNGGCYNTGWYRYMAPGQYVVFTGGTDWGNRVSSLAVNQHYGPNCDL